jgi:alpha-tubulin suppressor-like RCC1 family protein
LPQALIAILLFTANGALAATLGGIDAIRVSLNHTCIVTDGGGAKCWGRNSDGELGDGTTTSRFTPADVLGLTSGVSAVVPGGFHTCALTLAGGVKCWGGNGYGEIGGSGPVGHPVDVSGLGSGVSQIAPGWYHTCALTTAGGVKCWGRTLYTHPDGYVEGIPQPLPADVPGLESGVVQISANVGTTCAVTNQARAKCWGFNIYGDVGDGTAYPRPLPVEVVGLADVSAISAGGSHTCALTYSGAVKCWGLNDNAQLGSVPTYSIPTPVDVAGLGSGVAAIAAGHDHTCALMSAGTVKCWGASYEGQLGNGSTGTFGGQATPLEVPGIAGAIAIASGYHYSCALLSDHTARCWGENGSGQLGIGNYGPPLPYPTPVGSFVLQTITYPKMGSRVVNASPFQPAATASSGLPVTFESRTPQTCTASGSTVTLLAIGVCELAAQQVGNADYARAPEARSWLLVTGSPTGGSPRLRSISTRAKAGLGDDVVIAGFVINGAAFQQKQVLIRARGPSLAAAGVANVLGNPRLRLLSGQSLVGTNDDWQEGPQTTLLDSIRYAPSDPFESAIFASLSPGAYTAVAFGTNDGTGVTIVEVVEVDHPEIPLSGISTRAAVLTGDDVMIGGFAIEGPSAQTVVVRARGPSLAPAGIANPLSNPVLQLVRSSDGAVIAANDDWGSANNAAELSASGFAPGDALESAILVTLQPGAYTAIVRGSNGGTGVGIVEVFAR